MKTKPMIMTSLTAKKMTMKKAKRKYVTTPIKAPLPPLPAMNLSPGSFSRTKSRFQTLRLVAHGVELRRERKQILASKTDKINFECLVERARVQSFKDLI